MFLTGKQTTTKQNRKEKKEGQGGTSKKKEMQGWWKKVGHAWGQGITYQGKNAEDLSEKSIRWGWKGGVGFRKVELINSDNRL